MTNTGYRIHRDHDSELLLRNPPCARCGRLAHRDSTVVGSHRARYELFTSAYALAELNSTPAGKARRALTLIRDVPLLEEPAGFQDVVNYCIEHQLMPADARGDAAHLALAPMHGMAFLLTWNCQHLANANKTRHLMVLNARLGLQVPLIATPLTLLSSDRP